MSVSHSTARAAAMMIGPVMAAAGEQQQSGRQRE
jgi:hypothetical protein